MSINNYLFIDGNYLRRAYEDTMQKFFLDVSQVNIDFAAIKRTCGASKAFYYDVVDYDAPDAEERKAFLDEISSLDGFHVREGTLSKRDKKRQKQVDVALAVECLTHASHKNAWHVTLLAGDLDFKPLVDALVNLGTHVHVFYEHRSASKPLYRAADVAQAITLRQFWEWSSVEYRKAQPAPHTYQTGLGQGTHPPGIVTLDSQGTWSNHEIRLYGTKDHESWILALMGIDGDVTTVFAFPNRERLLQYFELLYGPVMWNK